MKAKGISVKIAVSTFALLGVANTCFALDLLEAYSRAVQYDPELLAQRYAYEADQLNLGIAQGALLPTVTLNGKISRNHQPQQSNTISGLPASFSNAFVNDTTTTRQASVTARQPLFRMDAIQGYKQVKTSVSIGELNFRLQQQQHLLKVTEAYLNVLRQQALSRAAQQEQQTLEAQLNMMQGKLKQGLVARSDVSEAQAQFDNARANHLAAEVQLQLAQEQLAQYIGPFNEHLADVDSSNFNASAIQPNNLAVWLDVAQQQNLQLQLARLQQRYSQDQHRVEQAARYPQLDAFASYAYSQQSPETVISSNGRSDQVGLELSWTLFNGGRTQGSIAKARRNMDKASADVDTATRNTQIAVKKAFLQLQNDQNQLQARKSALASAQLVAQTSVASYREGLKSMVDVLLAQRNAYAAQQDYVNTQYDYLLHVLQLKAAAGQLNLDSLKDLNSWLTLNNSNANTPSIPPLKNSTR